MEATLSFKLKNSTAELVTLQQNLQKIAQRYNLSKRCLLELDLAAEELFTNIVSYGFKDNREHLISIKISCFDNQLTMRIEDDGIPFNPLKAARPDVSCDLDGCKIGGLGIYLTRHVSSDITYERKNNRNVLTLTKEIENTT